MSLVTKDEIRSLAQLARLQLNEDELAGLQKDLGEILEHMNHIAELDTKNVEPMTHVSSAVQALRPDVVTASLDQQEVLAASHRSEDGCFAVPAILPSGRGQ